MDKQKKHADYSIKFVSAASMKVNSPIQKTQGDRFITSQAIF